MDDQWKQSVEKSLAILHSKVEKSSRRIDDLLNAWDTVKDGFHALETLARIGKVFLWISGSLTALYLFLTTWGHRP